jgi:hypothetical protein
MPPCLFLGAGIGWLILHPLAPASTDKPREINFVTAYRTFKADVHAITKVAGDIGK